MHDSITEKILEINGTYSGVPYDVPQPMISEEENGQNLDQLRQVAQGIRSNVALNQFLEENERHIKKDPACQDPSSAYYSGREAQSRLWMSLLVTTILLRLSDP